MDAEIIAAAERWRRFLAHNDLSQYDGMPIGSPRKDEYALARWAAEQLADGPSDTELMCGCGDGFCETSKCANCTAAMLKADNDQIRDAERYRTLRSLCEHTSKDSTLWADQNMIHFPSPLEITELPDDAGESEWNAAIDAAVDAIRQAM